MSPTSSWTREGAQFAVSIVKMSISPPGQSGLGEGMARDWAPLFNPSAQLTWSQNG
jgi:hypothetical protein